VGWWPRRREDRAPAPVPEAPVRPATSPRSAETTWRALPTLQRVSGEVELVAPRDAFASSLSSWQNPSFLGPLGHTVDPHGPSGVVEGLAAPVAARSDLTGDLAGGMPLRPVAPPPRPSLQRMGVQQMAGQQAAGEPTTEAVPDPAFAAPPPWRVQAVPAAVTPPVLTRAAPVEAPRLDLPVVAQRHPSAVVQRAPDPVTQSPPTPTTATLATPAAPMPPAPAGEPPPLVLRTAASSTPVPTVARANDEPTTAAVSAAAPVPVTAPVPATPPVPVHPLAPATPDVQRTASVPPVPTAPLLAEEPPVRSAPVDVPGGPVPHPVRQEQPAAATTSLPVVTRAEAVPEAGATAPRPDVTTPTLTGPAAVPVVSRATATATAAAPAPLEPDSSTAAPRESAATAPTLPGPAVPLVSRSADSVDPPAATSEGARESGTPGVDTGVDTAELPPPASGSVGGTRSPVVSRTAAGPLLGEPIGTATPSTASGPASSPRRLGLGPPLTDPTAVQRAVPLATAPSQAGPPPAPAWSDDPVRPAVHSGPVETGATAGSRPAEPPDGTDPLPLPPSLQLSTDVDPVLPVRPLLGTGSSPTAAAATTVQRAAEPAKASPVGAAPPVGAALPVAQPGTVAPFLPPVPATTTLSRSIATEALPPPRPALDPASAAIQAGIAHRDTDGSVVFGPPPVAAGAPAVQRAFEAEDPPPGAPTSSLGPEATPGPAADPPVTGPVTGPVPAAGAGGPAVAGAPNLDELARRLFDPLSAHIKAELRLDRERAGLVTDLRR
jgi:hypothetical protein